MLIDNVGLHRIFGLPVRDRDWEAMFEGRDGGKCSALDTDGEQRAVCVLLSIGR